MDNTKTGNGVTEMSTYNCYDDAFDPKYGDPVPVPIVMATKETLRGYGTIVTSFDEAEVEITPWPVTGKYKLYPGTGILGGVRSGDFTYKWKGNYCTAINEAVDGDVNGNYVTGVLPKHVSSENRTHVLIKEPCYHPDGGQVFFPKNGDPFVAVLALPKEDVQLEDFVAFYCDGSFGVNIHACVWHEPVYPITDEAVVLTKQGAVHACICIDTAEEFGKYLLVPLTKPEMVPFTKPEN